MHIRHLLPLVLVAIACTKPNPEFCDSDETCESGTTCDLSVNRCVPTPDAASTDVDAAVADAATLDAKPFDASPPDAAFTCDNGELEDGEVCDGDNLDGETCVSLGFISGTLVCGEDCLAFDTSGCVAK